MFFLIFKKANYQPFNFTRDKNSSFFKALLKAPSKNEVTVELL
jgi:hypothetical protein